MSKVTPISEANRIAARRESLPDALTTGQMRKRSMERMRFALTSLVEQNGERVQAWLNAIAVVDGPKAALDGYLKILEFALPKLSRAEVSVEVDNETQKAELTMDELQQIIREARTIEGTATHVKTEDDFTDLIS